MKLPHLFTDEKSTHLLLLFLLATTNLLLVVFIFILLEPSVKKLAPKVLPISSQTPIIDFNLVSPQAGSTVSGVVLLVTTLTNGPKIVGAQLSVDGQKVQTVTSQRTNRLTLYWDSTKVVDGDHAVQIKINQDNSRTSMLSTTLNVQNNVSRSVGQR